GLISNGSGTWLLSGANTHTGTVTVESGTLTAGNAQACGPPNQATVNGGTLDLGGFDTTFTSLSGTGGSVALGSATLTLAPKDPWSYAGGITGTGGVIKAGGGTQTLSGASTYTGATSVNGGSLVLGFNNPGAPINDIISSAS